MCNGWGRRAQGLGLSLLCLIAAAPRSAASMQPLAEFVAAARQSHPDALEARATYAEKRAGVTQALGKVLPGLELRGTYTQNQLDIRPLFSLAPGAPPQRLSIMPRNQWDGSGTVSLALLDLASDMRLVAAYRNRDGQSAQLRATLLQVEANVAQAYFQAVASHALVDASERALEVARASLDLAKNRVDAGSAAVLEMDRAEAEVQSQVQHLAAAELSLALDVRSLQSLSDLAPEMGTVPSLKDDLHAEEPLAHFEVSDARIPGIVAAQLGASAAQRSADADWLTLIPTLRASFAERLTNATSFTGRSATWAAVVQAQWQFDALSVGNVQAGAARAAAGVARLRRTRLAARDTVHRYWSQVLANIARSRAARIAERVSKEAVELAQDRYQAGVVTQLDLLQAQRDSYQFEVSRVAADADLVNSRLQLRLAAGHDVESLTKEKDRAVP